MNKLPNKIPVNLGDKRLDKRYETIIEASLKQPKQSIPSIFQNWHQIKAVYRFFDNPKVTSEKLIDHQYKQTISHIKNVEKEEGAEELGESFARISIILIGPDEIKGCVQKGHNQRP